MLRGDMSVTSVPCQEYHCSSDIISNDLLGIAFFFWRLIPRKKRKRRVRAKNFRKKRKKRKKREKRRREEERKKETTPV